jgi:ribosome-binding protein aMBF1 (putative translation factor)
MILRVRLEDGTMERIQVPPGQESILSIKQAVSKVTSNIEGLSILFGSSPISDDSMTLTELGLKHGSLVTLLSSSPKQKKKGESSITKTIQKTKESDRWDPFPEIAKDYESAVRNTKRRRSTGSGMSYGDLAKLQSSLHTVEPQPEGPFQRVYMCRKSAERFQKDCLSQKTQSYHNRVGLLLGNISRERVDARLPVSRTSLSSTTDEQKYCSVVKVQAVWEPPQQTRHHYDSDALLNVPPLISVHARRVADWLGLRPVGWIFSYDDNRNDDTEDSLPVYQSDIQEAAVLQIHNMKNAGRTDGCSFATLAMDARTGATEAFQLSDVCVQMVAEGMIVANDEKKKDGRYCQTKHAVVVDGKETQQLDSVLCLVNTAMLSHEGSFAGNLGSGSSVKKNGSLTNKARKAILKAMDDDDSNDALVLELLCDFSILLALDDVLDVKDSERLCKTVQKWARGQKKGTNLDDDLKLRLKSILV